MRFNYFVVPLVLFPLHALAHTEHSTDKLRFLQNPVSKNTIVNTYSNEAEGLKQLHSLSRTIDFPTQIIRISGDLKGKELTCEQVNEQIEETVFSHITSDKFMYNILINCGYDPNTNYATSFFINSYFDPKSDEAVDYLKDYLSQYNGSDFLGTKLNIESVKAVVVALNIAAGMKKKPNTPPFIEYQQDRSNFYFSNNYEMSNKLFTDIYQNFFSNDPEKILPFLDRWVFNFAGSVYQAVLKDSNYVELQPERIFLMENGEKIFVSGLKYYFSHVCERHENHRCLA